MEESFTKGKLANEKRLAISAISLRSLRPNDGTRGTQRLQATQNFQCKIVAELDYFNTLRYVT